MSSAVSPSQVTSSTPILVTTPTSDTKSFNEHKRDESNDDQRQQLNKQLNRTYTRGNSNKNKQLTRSHAMKESASPPRTPNSHSPNDMKSHSPTAPALMNPGDDGLQNPSTVASSSSLLLTAPPFILPESNSAGGKSQLDIEFPKLTPPKTKVGWNSSSSSTGGSQRNNNSRKSVSSDTSSTNNSLCEDINESHINDKGSQSQQQQQKTGSQIISVSTTCTQLSSASSPLCDKKQQQYSSSNDNNNECEKNLNESFNNINLNNNNNNNSSNSNNNNNNHDERVISPSRAQCKSPNYNDSNNNNGSSKSTSSVYPLNIKGKPPLKNMGSSSSCEGGNTSSGFISRDSSSEQFVDQNGIDLVQFFKETLNKNAKDRNMLMKIERDLSQLAVDQTGRTFIKFPPMSSYNRMLVHRTAAYFGMDHNVDSTQQCVIASTTKDTRIPDIRFKTLIRDTFSEEPRKSILKREAHSFEDYRQGGLLSVQRSILNRKAKSFEERDEEYEKYEKEWQWIHHDGGGEMSNKLKVPIRFMKIHASKSHSFGGYGGSNATLMRDDSITSSRSAGPRLHKQDSTTSTTWRLSPSSSGYKTQSLRSDSSPTGGYGSDTPEPSSAQSPDASRGVVWAVTDLASVPKGSLIIDPQTLQPILNQDGSLYHFDPSNPPTTSARYSNTGNSRKKPERQKSLNNNNINSNAKPNNFNANNNNNTNNNSMMMVINNIGNTDNSDKSAILINNKHSLSHTKINHLTTNNNNDIIDDDDEDIDDDDDYDHTDVMPFDAISPKIHDDACKTKDDNCENKSSQCELKPQSSHLNAEELMSPKQKNQSTSPNLPITESTINDDEYSYDIQESVTPTSSVQPIIEEDVNVDSKKDELTSVTETPPVQEIRFQTNPYTNNTTVTATPTLPPVLGYPTAASFTTTPIETAGTIYHTGENEVPSCWVPIFDQGARDPNLTVLPVATPYNGPTLYQSPVVYSTEQFTNPPAIAGQYPVGAYPMGYATYPVNGAPYQNIWPQPMTYFLPPSATPGPTQTVLVPPAAPQTPNATLIQSTASNTHTPSTNSTGRRNSPLTNNQHVHTTQAHGSSTVQTSTAMPIQTFPSSVPFSLAATSDTTSGSGPALYAIPPSVYPNVLPYPAPATGFYQQLPHPQTNTTIISSVIPHSSAHHPSSTVPSTPHSYHTTSASGEIVTHFPFNHQPPGHSNGNNATSTPQSAPSTPLSLTTMPPNFKNPPLFTTQPLIATAPVHIAAHYDMDKKTNSITSVSSAPKKYNNGGNGILSTPPTAFPQHSNITKPSNGGSSNRPPPLTSYQTSVSTQSGKKSINNSNNNNNSSNSHSEDTNSLSNSNMSSNYSSSNRIKNSSTNRDQTSSASGSYQPKSSYNNNNNNNKSQQQQQQQHHQQSYSSNSNSPNSNDNSESTNVSVSGSNNGKYPPRGPGTRIPPLDLKRNNSSANVVTNHHTRSTPSTNSTESNNSPNSITSYDHSRNYHYTSQHYQHQHHPQQHQPYHHQPHYSSSNTSGHNSGTHYYRGGSAGAINTNIHHNTNNNSHNSTESPSIQTCFPFNVHSQNPGTSTPLLDSCHPQQLIGYNNPMAAGMYVKFGQAFTFANPLPNNRKSPSNDIRAPLAPLAGVYSTMMLPGGPRQMNPRTMQNNHNYKGNRTQQR
ncbi:protein encore isoform X3 [Chironomus tepperi]|uniref:protein encore isoform X3 n=1 Tax=Chironomus tepperi TaxID=113505 RepID=UPI00391F9282